MTIHPYPHSKESFILHTREEIFSFFPLQGRIRPLLKDNSSLNPGKVRPTLYSRRDLSFFPSRGDSSLFSLQGKFIPPLTPWKVHPTYHSRGDLPFFPHQGRFIPFPLQGRYSFLLFPREIHPSFHSKENPSLSSFPGEI
jgi:hypothetical protein